MRLYVDVMDPTTIAVHKDPTGREGVRLDFGDEVKIWINQEQATKLCFDLLASVPPIEVAAHLAHGAYPEPVAK